VFQAVPSVKGGGVLWLLATIGAGFNRRTNESHHLLPTP
jgi:hypothetical protein